MSEDTFIVHALMSMIEEQMKKEDEEVHEKEEIDDEELFHCECGFKTPHKHWLNRHKKGKTHEEALERGEWDWTCNKYGCEEMSRPGWGGLCKEHREIMKERNRKEAKKRAKNPTRCSSCGRRHKKGYKKSSCKKCIKSRYEIKKIKLKSMTKEEKREYRKKENKRKRDRKKQVLGRICIECNRTDSETNWSNSSKYCGACGRARWRNGICPICGSVIRSSNSVIADPCGCRKAYEGALEHVKKGDNNVRMH